jgi:hypothetical protein
MAVKEILYKEQKEVERLRQSEQILTILHHPNITMYYGLQIQRDRVFLLSETLFPEHTDFVLT